MNAKEKDAIDRIRESLTEFEGSRYAQHVLYKDLETLLDFVEKKRKKITLHAGKHKRAFRI